MDEDVANHISPGGLAALEAELHALETDARQQMAERLRNAVVVEPAAADGAVGIGVAVTVRDLDSGREATHEIVSATESDPANGRLGIDSPLGQALAGS